MPNYHYYSPDSMMRNRQGCQCQMPRAEQTREQEFRMREVREECCEERKDMFYGMPLGMAYVPWQQWRKLYEAEKGFRCGTIFSELDKPFKGIGGSLR